MSFPVQKTEQEWRSILSPEEYTVLRNKGTESPGPTRGHFVCKGCKNPLYSAESKFQSGCGWPAFDKCYEGSVVTQEDNSCGRQRIEIMCGKCGGHLGHVFSGERLSSTEERHCVNSLSIQYQDDSHQQSETPLLAHQ